MSNFEPEDVFGIGATTVIYTAEDTEGNQAFCSFEVVVERVDKIPVCVDWGYALGEDWTGSWKSVIDKNEEYISNG